MDFRANISKDENHHQTFTAPCRFLIMRKIYFVALLALASACYRPPTVDGFDPVLWRTAIDECGTYRVEAVRVLLDQKDQLLGLNQNEIA